MEEVGSISNCKRKKENNYKRQSLSVTDLSNLFLMDTDQVDSETMHSQNTTQRRKIIIAKSCCSPLDRFQLVDVGLSMRGPDSVCIFNG